MGSKQFLPGPGLLLLLLSLPLALSPASASQAEPATPTITQLAPAAKHANLDKTISRLLTHYHYRQSKLNNALAAAILDGYLEALDHNRSYFLASDIANFKRKYRFTLDNHLQAGNLWPAYDIINVYRRRLAERTESILEQLKQKVDFDRDEFFELDREDAAWATTSQELDEIWRKRLKHELLTLMLTGKTLDEARTTLTKRYERQLRRAAQYNSDDVFQLYMNAVSRSFDPHTAYFSPRTTENFNIQMRLSLEGIGAVLRMEDDFVTVVELVPGGPADLSGQIQPEDKITGVAQGDKAEIVDIFGWRLDDVVDLIRGPRGSVVRLQVVHADTGSSDVIETIRLVRDTIKLEKQAASSEVRSIKTDQGTVRIGIITIPTFYSDFLAAQQGKTDYRSTTRDVRQLLRQLRRERIDGVLIDLRQNGGGSLQEAVELTGLFIDEGPIVQVRNTHGGLEVENDPDPALVYDGPLAVLVDRFSASASEIFAGAIQDYGRGIVIGHPTFGKGTVQTLVDLGRFLPKQAGSLGQLKLTVAKFYRISGSSTQHRGVLPDISFPSLFGDDEVGESSQEHALPWDEIQPWDELDALRYANQRRMIAKFTPELKRRHQARAAQDQSFKTLVAEIEAAKQAREKTKVSLRKSQREAERDKAAAERRERTNRWRQARGLEPLAEDESASEREEAPDLLLDESTAIIADMVSLLKSDPDVGKSIWVMTGSQ